MNNTLEDASLANWPCYFQLPFPTFSPTPFFIILRAPYLNTSAPSGDVFAVFIELDDNASAIAAGRLGEFVNHFHGKFFVYLKRFAVGRYGINIAQHVKHLVGACQARGRERTMKSSRRKNATRPIVQCRVRVWAFYEAFFQKFFSRFNQVFHVFVTFFYNNHPPWGKTCGALNSDSRSGFLRQVTC